MSNKILTFEERKLIEKYLNRGMNQSEISKILRRNRSTISRELKRNHYYQCHYIPEFAEYKYFLRKTKKRNKPKSESLILKELIKKYLKLRFTPDVMVGRFKLEGNPIKVSVETIYKIIWNDYHKGGNLWEALPCNRKKRKRHLRRPDLRKYKGMKRMIDERPEAVNRRGRIGHWEGDTIIGAKHKGAVLTLLERKSRFAIALKLKNKTSKEVADKMEIIGNEFGNRFSSLTFDNGLEFSAHKEIENKISAKVYFAYPASPWQRGSNENFNRILRRHFPKKTNLKKISQKSIDKALERINNTPRKILGYKTPYEVFYNLFVAMLN